MKAIDFFCGAGGLTRGLLDAGIEVLVGVDNDARLRATYERNNAPARFKNLDVKNLDVVALRREVGIREGDSVLYAACTPCQPFSSLNRARATDDRKELLLVFAEIVRAAPPDYIIVENVPGLNTSFGRDIHDRFIQILNECGFAHWFSECLDAKEFAVPQTRKRFVLLASRHGDMSPPQVVPGPHRVREHIARFPAILDGEVHSTIPNHSSRKMMPHHRVIVEAIPINGGSRSDVVDQSILLPCHRANPKVHKDVFGRMHWDAASPTLTARCTDVYCGRFVHPQQHRGISLREAAAIQTFSDDYVFEGTMFHIAAQIGNAVPVRFARQMGEAVLRSAGEAIRQPRGS